MYLNKVYKKKDPKDVDFLETEVEVHDIYGELMNLVEPSLKIGNNWRVIDSKCVEKQITFTSAEVTKGKVSYSRKLYVLKNGKRGKF